MKLLPFILSAILMLNMGPVEAMREVPRPQRNPQQRVIMNDIPELEDSAADESLNNWKKKSNAAQYGKADWSNVVGIVHDTTVKEAKKLANENSDITYFFYLKGGRMTLINDNVYPHQVRIFHHGDAVFFSGEPWWGSAPGLADGYVKTTQD